MANIDRFMIAPILSGQQTDQKPFMIPDDAFQELTNAYVFRGRVRKRFGARLMNNGVADNVAQLHSRLRLQIGTTDGTGSFNITFPAAPASLYGTIFKIGQIFSVGDTIFTVYQATGATLSTSVPVLPAVLPATATFDVAIRTLVITGNNNNLNTPVYFYPSTPVMGLLTYDSAFINDEPVYAFDQQFSYEYVNGGWERLGANTIFWTGTDTNFFYGCNWRGINNFAYCFYVTNNNVNDGIRYWRGDTNAWVSMDPPLLDAGATRLQTTLILIPYHGRLLAMNTWEDGHQFPNRIRWSQLGDPTTTVGNNVAWLASKGAGFMDASTKEQIVSCAYVKDHLIIYFERSTWELVFTGNEVDPFYFQRINQDLGAESTFSIVPFDKVILGIGNTGVHACNGANVERIDDKIPDSVFQISNGNIEVKRVCGIRDYYTQMVYWAFPYNIDSVYPNRILVYNYLTMSWAFNDDSITCFGYYQDRNIGRTWAGTPETWAEMNQTWNAGVFESRYRNILAGNQEGYVFIVDPDRTFNCEALQITNVTAVQLTPLSWRITVYADQHNLIALDDFIKIKNCSGTTVLNNNIYQVETTLDENTFTFLYKANPYKVDQIRPLPDILPIPPFSGVYKGGGTLTRVSKISIKTKQYNFYMQQGRNAYISKVDFNVDTTVYGQILIDTFIGSSRDSINDSHTGALIGTYVLETNPYVMEPYHEYEQFQNRVWHPMYLQCDGECIQLHIYMSDSQMRNPLVSESAFELNAMTFYATPTSSRLE